MYISVIGTGYVGLVTGVCLAETGNEVICVDNDQNKIDLLSQGVPTIYESGLKKMLQDNLKHRRIRFTDDLEMAVKQADIMFLALPTPPSNDGSADLSFVKSVAKDIGHFINGYKIIVNKSTVPIGTSELVKSIIEKTTTSSFDVVSNPEFLREGMAINDFMRPERVIIGTQSEKAKEVMQELYAPFVRQGNPIYFMDERSAELTKYAANAFLATKISFMNELAQLSEKVGANIDDIRLGMGSDSRIGKSFLFAGIGFGGSCFPKDISALAHLSRANGYDFKILDAISEVNNMQKTALIPKILNYFNHQLEGKKMAIWGLSFKPNTDDIREAPAIEIIQKLTSLGVHVAAYDPEAIENAKKVLSENVTFHDDQYDVLIEADCLIIATEWAEFRTPDFERMSTLLKNKLIFDGRNLYDLDKIEDIGYQYFSIGRKDIT